MGVTTELRISLPGAEGAADARRALAILDRVLSVLGRLEDAAVDRESKTATVWGFTHLGLGSVITTIAPNIPRHGSTSDVLDTVMTRTVDGFATAEDREGVPDGWDVRAVKVAAELAELLGFLPSTVMVLELLRDREPVREVTVTRRSAEHLRAAMRPTHRSIGAVTGKLESISQHRGWKAGLWQEGTGRRVEIRFRADQEGTIVDAFGKRVMISGELVRDAFGRPAHLLMRSIEVLAETTAPLTDLVGADPDMTGGLDAADYLREIRGAS
jgi:hypothetical protein